MNAFHIIVACSCLLSQCIFARTTIQDLQQDTRTQTRVMVVGSYHLSNVTTPLNASSLQSVVNTIDKFNPTAIGVESLRPQDIITMINSGDTYQDVTTGFVGSAFIKLARATQEQLGITANQAIQQLEALTAQSDLSEEQRARAVSLAIASYNKYVALLHWQRLNIPIGSDVISPEINRYLEQLAKQNNEINHLASPLASAADIETLYPIDDHLDKDIYPRVVAQLMDSYKASEYAVEFANSEYVSKPIALAAEAEKTGDWLSLYAWMNSEEYISQTLDKEWRMFIDKDLDVNPALARVALWEVRNLNMASNIMRVVASNVGGNIVIIVGASHKAFLDQYLENMIGVSVVQFSDYLPQE